jgi:type I restriction enzyme S subunit
MNAERLLAHYGRIADGPDAIGRLRRFILDLAVRGKLVPQDSSDEPASELLKRVAKEKLDQAGLPQRWRRAKIGSILEFQYGKGLKAAKRSEEGPVPVFGSNGIVGFTDEPLTVRPSIIIGRKGSAGALNLCDRPSWTTDVAYFVEAPSFLDLRFMLNALAALDLDKLGKGVKPGLGRSEAYDQIIAVPPLAEQRRIVAKVDELMGLCDRLAAARAAREAVRDRLMAASLARLNAPDPKAFQSDAGFALDALPALTTRPDQIKALRQSILNLAVRGQLVPQDAKDEPASELLKRIAREKARLVKEGKAKRQDLLPEIDLDQLPFALPVGWAWGRFPEVGAFGRGKSKHRPRNDPALFYGGEHLMIQTGDVARSQGVIETYTSKYNDFGLSQSFKWPKGTLCITIAANIADSGILSFDACFPDSVVGFIPASMFENARYFEYFVRTAKANLLEFAPATAQKNINLEILTQVLIPLPPLAEQRRIVAKVDALMALCDRLEAGLTATAATRRRLLDALLAEALTPDAECELEAAE